jgi:hypothetical protein
VIEELTTHTFIEEKIFCPASREAAPDTKDLVLESVDEHYIVLWMLSELKGPRPRRRAVRRQDDRPHRKRRHHVEEEEKEWFPEVRKAMGPDHIGRHSPEVRRSRSACRHPGSVGLPELLSPQAGAATASTGGLYRRTLRR